MIVIVSFPSVLYLCISAVGYVRVTPVSYYFLPDTMHVDELKKLNLVEWRKKFPKRSEFEKLMEVLTDEEKTTHLCGVMLVSTNEEREEC